jgi:hypothetical protein
VDAVLGAALRIRGADIRIVRCDGIYPVCDVLAWSGPLAAEHCKACAANGSKLFASLDLPTQQMRSYLAPEDFAAIARWAAEMPVSNYATALWNGVEIGKWVTSSVFSYFRITQRELARPDVQAVHRRYLETGALTWLALSRIMDDYQPSHCVVFNGRMAPFRVAMELAKHRGVPILTHERGWCNNTFIFFENENCLAAQPIYTCAERWNKIPLLRSECLEVKSYLDAWESGKGSNYPSFYSYNTGYTIARHALRIPEGVKILLVLTSSEFELAESEHYLGMEDQLELIDRLIEAFRHREEFLVVRHHPYIAGTKQVPADYHFLTRAYRQAASAPANVRIIMPSEPLSSYGLYWSVDASISFISTAGLEALARGLSTASLPESLFRQAMSDVIEQSDVESLNTLVDDLFRKTEAFSIEDLRRVYRFLHSYIRRLPKRFKSFGIKDLFEPELRFDTLEGLAPGQDKELDGLCEHLVSGASFWSTPSVEDQGRDVGEENDFLREQIVEVLERRARIRQERTHFLQWRLFPTVAILRIDRDSATPDLDFRAWGAHPFRHGQVREYDCHVDVGAGHPEAILAIASKLTTVREDYVLITSRSSCHDASLASIAVDQLLDDTHLAIDGVLFGAWLISPDNRIMGEIFTERVPAETYEEAIALMPVLRDPLFFLSFGLFRKGKLLQLLNEIARLPDVETASRQFFAALRRPSFHRWLLPMLAMARPTTIAEPLC